MSIQRLNPDDIEIFTIETTPSWNYSSGSSGVSGSQHVFQRRSASEKEVFPLSVYGSSMFQDKDLNANLKLAKEKALLGLSNENEIRNYMRDVRAQQSSVRKQQTVEIIRFTPGFGTTPNMDRKQVVLDNLFPYYRCTSPDMHFGFTNYNSLNFISSSKFPSDSVLLYPQDVELSGTSIVSAQYIPSGAFTFDFWIKPNATTDTDEAPYKAGTIFHVSSCYAISLISGSSVDPDGKPNKFRLLFQLSSSADIAPSKIDVNNLPPFTFVSSDNSLEKDKWSHATIRWGTNTYNLGSGSMMVNSSSCGTFVIDKANFNFKTVGGSDGPNVLAIGNYYEGINTGKSSISRFFAADTATREGLLELNPATGVNNPDNFTFNHPLNAELSELKIYNKYLVNSEIAALDLNGPSDLSSLVFYLPPFFTEESPTRQSVNGSGGVFVTPYQTKTGTTYTPVSAELAFEIGGHYINLENFTRDFVNSRYPRLLNLTGSVITNPITYPQTANAILYSTGSVRRRNLTILPCDNGGFIPNYELLASLGQTYFVNDLGNSNLSMVSMRNQYSTGSLFAGLVNDEAGTIFSDLTGPDPTNSSSFGKSSSRVPTILQRTRDNNSNQIVFFDISNIFYDHNIEPLSVVITDSQLSGSEKISITLKDDGNGNLYRDNTTGEAATWNSVGNVFYNEGIIVIKHPSLFFFGENQFELTFKGRHNIHVMSIDCKANSGMVTKSSNPTFSDEYLASSNANEYDQKYVWISDILLHDENLNVVARTKLAQPFQKKWGDKVLFKVKLDW